MAPVKEVVRWKNLARVQVGTAPPRASSKTRGAVNMDMFFLFCGAAERYPRLEVEWRTATWVCDSPSHSEWVDNKSLSQRRCVVVDHLNKFETYLPNGSRRPIRNIVMVRNMRFVSQ
jgi:hypothetical protein